jgi:hypothetical protein
MKPFTALVGYTEDDFAALSSRHAPFERGARIGEREYRIDFRAQIAALIHIATTRWLFCNRNDPASVAHDRRRASADTPAPKPRG